MKAITKQFMADLSEKCEQKDNNNNNNNNSDNYVDLAGKHYLVTKELLFNFKVTSKPYYQSLVIIHLH